jgi:protein-tyrosine phosphatase
VAPLGANKIVDNLWMGSAPPEGNSLAEDFDILILCAVEYQPQNFPGLDVQRVELFDDGQVLLSDSNKREVIKLARFVIQQVKAGKEVLVTCVQGRNRSGLICALALMLGWGMTPEQATSKVRAARGWTALMNDDFNRFLKTVGKVQSEWSSHEP